MLPDLFPQPFPEEIIIRRTEYDTFEEELKDKIFNLYKHIVKLSYKEVNLHVAETLYTEARTLEEYFHKWRGIGYGAKQDFLHALVYDIQYKIKSKLSKNIKKSI